jgi:hypothetical protein
MDLGPGIRTRSSAFESSLLMAGRQADRWTWLLRAPYS